MIVFTGVPFAFLFEELLLNSDTICRSGHYIVVYYNASVRNVDKFFRKTSLFTGLWSVLQINNSRYFTILSSVLPPKSAINILATSD
jgi:hypothetical protein